MHNRSVTKDVVTGVVVVVSTLIEVDDLRSAYLMIERCSHASLN